MKHKILLLACTTALLASCSSTYRNGQTPDDVYYSPVRLTDDDNQKEEQKRDQVSNQHDRQIRMARYDRRWRDLDDFDCRYDPYRYGYGYGYYYNPYYYPFPVFFSSPIRNPKNNAPRTTSLGSYRYEEIKTVNPKTGVVENIYRGRRYNQSNAGRVIREIFSPSNNQSSGGNNNSTYSPSSSGSRSSGAPVSRPARGNR